MDPLAWIREQDAGVQALVVGVLGAAAVVALVVAVAVAAVVGSVVLDADGAGSPEATFASSEDDGSVTVTFERGDPLRAGDVVVVLDDGHAGHTHEGTWAELAGVPAEEPVPAGSSVTVERVGPGDAVRVRYRDGSESTLLFEHGV